MGQSRPRNLELGPESEHREDSVLRSLADELSELEGISVEVAYSIIQRHGLLSVKEARSE